MNTKKLKRALKRKPGTESTDYDVGYGKTPKHTRFQPGQSGNPRGRPRGARNKSNLPAINERRLQNMIQREAYRSITVRDGDHLVDMPAMQAVVRGVFLNAAKGNHKSQQTCAEWLSVIESENNARHAEGMNIVMDYKIRAQAEVERCKKAGESDSDIVPHPDDLHIDFNAGTVELCGPMDKDEKNEWDRMRRFKALCDDLIARSEAQLAKNPDDQKAQQLLKIRRESRAEAEAFLTRKRRLV